MVEYLCKYIVLMFYDRDFKKITSLYESIYAPKRLSYLKEDTGDSEPKISKKVFDAFNTKLIRAADFLQQMSPFYYGMYNSLKVIPTFKTPTMSVDRHRNIRINPRFLLKELTIAQACGVLAHEVLHHVGNSFYRLEGRDMYYWNVATDYFINMWLDKDGYKLPEGVLLPTKEGDRYIIKKYNNLGIAGLDTTNGLDITDMFAESLYDIIVEIKDKKKKEIQEDVKKSEESSKHEYDKKEKNKKEEQKKENNKQPKAPPADLEVGEIVRDPENNKFAKVTSIDKITGKAKLEPLSKEEAKKALEQQQSQQFYY